MNFTYDGADLSQVIKKYSKEKNNYIIEYLDGSKASYLCCLDSEEDKIKSKMINQALERQKHISLPKMELLRQSSFITSALACICASTLSNDSRSTLTLLLIILIMISIKYYRSDTKKLKELKKYRLFLKMVNDLDEVNKSEVLKCIEPDNIYQKDFNINTLDDYSYTDVKILYRKHKKMIKE